MLAWQELLLLRQRPLAPGRSSAPALLPVRSPPRRDIHPLLFGAALLAKKFVAVRAANEYGWARIYRRLAEQAQHHVGNPEDRRHVRSLLRTAIRAPATANAAFTDSNVYAFLEKVARDGDTGAKGVLPPFLYNLVAGVVKLMGAASSFLSPPTKGKEGRGKN